MTPPSQNVPASKATISFGNSLSAELVEKKLQELERSQKQLVALHNQNTDTFQDIIAVTNGKIVMYVRILPSVVLEQTKDLMQWTSVPKEAPPPLVSSTREDLKTVGFNSALTGLMDFY